MSWSLTNGDCFSWMKERSENSVTAIVTDPPYGVKEYTDEEMEKRRLKKGGIWRLPPSFDGHKRQALPRFSVINDSAKERSNVYEFFCSWAELALRVIVPGGHVFVASTPLLSDILSKAMRDAGFERRGEIIRTVSTLRGGDRPKGAEEEFSGTSVIPKGMWEPWGLYRKPLSEKTVAENLRKWNAGALRRESGGAPFCDFIESGKTPRVERAMSPHPSLKPQKFMRKIVRASLPVGKGTLLDTFAGGGATLAAAVHLGYDCIGIEKSAEFCETARTAIEKLAALYPDSATVNQQKAKTSASEAYRQEFFYSASGLA